MPVLPTETPEWASTAGRRLEPTAAEKDSGFNEGTRSPARKANWVLGVVSDWAAYIAARFDSNEELVYQSTRSRTTFLHSTFAMAGAQLSSTPGWLLNQVNTNPNSGVRMESTQNSSRLLWSLEDHLPEGAVVSRVSAIVQPGALRSAGDRMTLGWFSETVTFFSGSYSVSNDGINDETEDDGSLDVQEIEMSGLSIPVQSQYDPLDATVYETSVISLRAGIDGGTHAGDTVYGLKVDWTDPGPRNF